LSTDSLPFDETFLKQKLNNDPNDWQTRRAIAHGLFDKRAYEEAADTLWSAPEVPSTDLDLAFMIRVLAKARPHRAIRLISAVLELNRGKAVQNMGMTNALMHHGMVMQAARFYSAAVEADPSMVNPDLEYFMLWSDDAYTMWGNFENRAPKLSDLPWMIRDPKEALRLTARVSLHTTPIIVPNLPSVYAEKLQHEMYKQEAKHEAKITPPPAVRIILESVNPKDRLYDEVYGAVPVSAPVTAPAAAPAAQPAASGFPEAPKAPAPVPAIPVVAPTPIPIAPAAAQVPVAVPSAEPIALPKVEQAPVAEMSAAPVVNPLPVGLPAQIVPASGSVPVHPTGTPTRALLPSGPAPTGAQRAILPSGPAPTGAPTRALLPSGTPPANPAGTPPRRLLTPSKPPTT
jgi:hypothetical protein